MNQPPPMITTTPVPPMMGSGYVVQSPRLGTQPLAPQMSVVGSQTALIQQPQMQPQMMTTAGYVTTTAPPVVIDQSDLDVSGITTYYGAGYAAGDEAAVLAEQGEK